jgi:hypothetical protein
MAVEFLSIVIFTFALALLVLGAVTWWIERGHRRLLGALMVGSALLIAGVYGFLGSRFSIALFGRLIIGVDLPRLMATAIVYTIGVLLGVGLAGGAFLWVSGRLVQTTRRVHPTRRVQTTRRDWQLAAFIGVVLLMALILSLIAVQISR